MISVKKVGDWDLARKSVASLSNEAWRALEKAISQEALFLQAELVKKIESSVPPANAAATVRKKNSSKTLIDSGDMRNSVTVIKRGGETQIGIPRSAKRYNLALIHEHGAVITQVMTDKQRRFLASTFKGHPSRPGKGTGIIVIHVPARPFISPVIARNEPAIPQRIWDRMQLLLRGSKP